MRAKKRFFYSRIHLTNNEDSRLDSRIVHPLREGKEIAGMQGQMDTLQWIALIREPRTAWRAQ
jgi:hypothetical protein